MVFVFVVDVPWWIELIVCVGLLVAALYAYTKYKQRVFYQLGIPGPTPTPFLGVLPEIQKNGLAQTDIQYIKRYGKYYGSFHGNRPTLVVADTEMIKEICVKQFNNFTDHPNAIKLPDYWNQSVVNSTGDHWKFLRATITPAFSGGKMRKMVPIVNLHIDRLVEGLETKMNSGGKNSVDLDLQKFFSSLAMDVVCGIAFGIDVDSQQNPDDPFVKHAKTLLSMSLGEGGSIWPILPLFFPWLMVVYKVLGLDFKDKDASPFLFKACRDVIAQRRAEGNDAVHSDLLQLMINSNLKNKTNADFDGKDDEDTAAKTMFEAYRDRGLTDDEIVANAVVFLLVGSDTSATVLCMIAYCLATNAEYQARVVEEIDKECGKDRPTYDKVFQLQYLDMFISETLRLHPPVAQASRQAVRDAEVCGVKIPAGMGVAFPFPAIHRHPSYWSSPETFDPERFAPENKANIVPYSYMPFGIGPRNCLGMRFAMLELKLTIVTLLQRYTVEVCSQTDVPAKMPQGFFLRPKNGLMLKLVKR